MNHSLQKKGVVYAMTIFMLITLAMLAVLFFVTQRGPVKTFSFVLFIIVLIVGLVYIYMQLTSVETKMRRKLKYVKKLVGKVSIDFMKHHYNQLHQIYSKLPERHKPHYGRQVNKIHQELETMLVAEKKIQALMAEAGDKTIEEQKEMFHTLHKLYRQLPESTKEKYYHFLVYVRKKLEHGN